MAGGGVLEVVVQYWSLNCSIKEIIYGSVSDMIASSLYNSSSATGVMEQNLDRLTVIMAVVFAVCVVLCMFFFPQGIVGY